MISEPLLSGRGLQAIVIPVTRVKQNCSLIWCVETLQAALVDPGGDLDLLRAVVADRGLTLTKLLITHGHGDHAGGAFDLSELMGVPIEGPHVADKWWIDQMADRGELYGLGDAMPFTPDRWLEDGDIVAVGRQRIEVLHCPGHTPGHIAYFSPEARIAFVGDIMFRGQIGASDIPRGDHAALLRSIRRKLLPLGDDVLFVPGHHVLSTFGDERRSNPYVSDTAAQKYEHLL